MSSVLQPVVKPVQPVRDRCVKHAVNLETETLDATLIDVSGQKTGLIIFKEVRRGRASATVGNFKFTYLHSLSSTGVHGRELGISADYADFVSVFGRSSDQTKRLCSAVVLG